MRALIGLALLAALALFGLDTLVRNGTLPAGGSAQATPTPHAPRLITRTVAAAEPVLEAAAPAAIPVTALAPSMPTAPAETPAAAAALQPAAPVAPSFPVAAASKPPLPIPAAKSKHAKLACGPGQKRDTVHHKCVAKRV